MLRTAALYFCALYLELQRLKTPIPLGLPEACASGSDIHRCRCQVSKYSISYYTTTGVALCWRVSDRTICGKTRSMYIKQKEHDYPLTLGYVICKLGISLSWLPDGMVLQISNSQNMQRISITWKLIRALPHPRLTDTNSGWGTSYLYF